MVKALIGRKIGITQVFDESGRQVPVTVLQVGPCTVVQVKTAETDSVPAVQIGFDERKRKHTSRPLAGHFDKAGVPAKRLLRDVAPDGPQMPQVGQQIGLGIFEGVAQVDVIGTSKGKGFAGVVKRYHFKGSPASHGGRFGRRTGSIGSAAWPGHVIKGHRMPGRMGNARVTVRNLAVVKLDLERNLMLVRGSVAGHNGSYVLVRKVEGAAPAQG
jgi:large subunit ribosomal protein L3